MARWRDDSESDFSETDISIDESPGRRRFKRTSVTRRRVSPDTNTFLTPGVVSVHRSHSTGGRQKRRESPAVVIDVNNDLRARNVSNDRRSSRLFNEVDDVEDIEVIRTHRRPRATSQVPSRAASPRDRDWELLMEQRLLEKNDQRQDLELLKQQQEIERLERKLAKRRENPETRLLLHEEEQYEDEISEKLRKLERLERHKRSEEDRKLAAYREKVKKLEEIERKAAEEEEAKRLAREEHLKALEKKEAARAEKERIKRELRDEEARKLLEEEERKKEQARLKAEAIKEWKMAEEAKKMKAIEEKEKEDKEFRERLKKEFGYSEEEIEALLKKRNKERSKSPRHHHHHDQTTYIKVHRKYLLPETLIAYRLPWDWDERDSNYIIIKTYVSEELQEELFAHTRRLRDGKLVTETSNTLTELKVNDRKRDKMYLVRKKGTGKSAFIITP